MINVFEQNGVGINYIFYVGHNSIRNEVVGMENRVTTPEELDRMKAMVKDGMELGAIGLSTTLMRLSKRFVSTDEVIELAKVVVPFQGVVDIYTRDPVNDLVGSVRECIEIGEKSGARPHLALHKAVGKRNWGKSKEVSDLIGTAIERGVEVTVDQFPYDGAATTRLINVLIPPKGISSENILEVLHDPKMCEAIQELVENPPPGVFSWVKFVGYEALRIVASERFPEYVGKMLVDIAEEKGVDPFEVIVKIVREEGQGTVITLGACSENDVRYFMTRPWTMIGSDGITGLGVHPRSYGTFPRILGRYVREWNILTLENAIHKMTGMTAEFFRLEGLGEIKKGYYADITVFDPENVIDLADYAHPNELAEGIVHVLVNGVLALENGEMTGSLNGRFIPYQGSTKQGN